MPGARWALIGAAVGLVVSVGAWAVDGFPARDLELLPMLPLMSAGFFLVLRGRLEFGAWPKPGDGSPWPFMLPGIVLIGLGAALYAVLR